MPASKCLHYASSEHSSAIFVPAGKKKKNSLSTYLGHKSELKMNFLFFKTNRALLLVYLVVSNSWSFVLKHKARLWAVYETWTLHFVSEMLFHSRWTELKGNT